MKTDWTEEYFTSNPKTFVKISDSTWLQRRNIRTRDRREDEPEDVDPGYICESRKISNDIYEALIDTLYTPSQTEIVNNQKTGEYNQVDIMEALADIYAELEALRNGR